VKALFETVAVPLAPPGTPGVFYRGLRTVAFDGLNSVKVPDSDRNRSWLGKMKSRLGLAGYPAMRIVALAETGTRGLLGAVTGARGDRNKAPLARELAPLLGKDMLLLGDRAYDAGACWPPSPRPGRSSWSAAPARSLRCPRRHGFPHPQIPSVTDGKSARRAGPLTARAPEAAQPQAASRPPKRPQRAGNCLQPAIVTVRQR
jgi:hypothetical protein